MRHPGFVKVVFWSRETCPDGRTLSSSFPRCWMWKRTSGISLLLNSSQLLNSGQLSVESYEHILNPIQTDRTGNIKVITAGRPVCKSLESFVLEYCSNVLQVLWKPLFYFWTFSDKAAYLQLMNHSEIKRFLNSRGKGAIRRQQTTQGGVPQGGGVLKRLAEVLGHRSECKSNYF